MRQNASFILVCVVLFVIGAGLRLASGGLRIPSFSGQLGLSLPASLAESELVPVQVGNTVLDFYNAVDKGRYAEAYALTLETHWSQTADGVSQVDGLTTEDQFVSSLTDELGANGMSLNIIAIQTLDQIPLPLVERNPEVYPELLALESLPAGARVEQVYRVLVGGTLLGRCSRWDWSKHVLIAKVKGDGLRVLLPGVKGPYQPHHEEWFLDRTMQTKHEIGDVTPD